MMDKDAKDDNGSKLVKKGMDIVKYSVPSLVMRTVEETDNSETTNTSIEYGAFETEEGRVSTAYPLLPKLPGLTRRKVYTRDTIFSTKALESLLDGMFPSKVWKDGNKIMGKSVTTEQVSRSELQYLRDEMKYKQAFLGIDKHSHSRMKVQLNLRCFDELIRQDTLNCVERGMFLKEIRDFLAFQFKMYRRIMRDSIRHVRKEIQRIEEDKTVQNLHTERASIVQEIHELSVILSSKEENYGTLERKYKCEADAIYQIREDEMSAVRKCNLNLMNMLEAVNPDCSELPAIRETLKQARKIIASTVENTQPGH